MLSSPKLPPLHPVKSSALLSPVASVRYIRQCVESRAHISLDPFFSPQHKSALSISPSLRPVKRQLVSIYPKVLEEDTDSRLLVERTKEPKHRQVLRALKDIRTYLPPVWTEVRGGRKRVLSFS